MFWPVAGYRNQARRWRQGEAAVSRRRFGIVRWLPFSTGLLVFVMTGAAPIACAELVVFTHGRVVKIASHRDAGDRIEIRFSGGGSLTLDRSFVERIEADEVATADVQLPPVQPPPQAMARVESPRPAAAPPAERVSTPTEPPMRADAPKATEERAPAPAPRRSRRHRH